MNMTAKDDLVVGHGRSNVRGGGLSISLNATPIVSREEYNAMKARAEAAEAEQGKVYAAIRDATGMDDAEIVETGAAFIVEQLGKARDEQNERAEAAEAERDLKDGELMSVRVDRDDQLKRAEAAEKRQGELVAALEKYGWHLNAPEICPAYWGPPNGPCTCGFDATLSAVKGGA